MVVILLLVPNVSSSSNVTQTTSVPSFQTKYHLTNSSANPPRPPLPNNNYRHHYDSFTHQSFPSTPDANKSPQNYSREFVNHVTRINISNDFSQIDGNAIGAPEAVVKEGESKKRKKKKLKLQK
jgi:pyruvate/2-oxoacid:ferredoxin oxidoreductase alpha subunit